MLGPAPRNRGSGIKIWTRFRELVTIWSGSGIERVNKPHALVSDLITPSSHERSDAGERRPDGREVLGVLRAVTADSTDKRLVDVVRFLVLGSRGGATRRKILAVLLGCPQNAHRICQTLSLNYGTVTSHLRVMERFGLVTAIGASRYNRGYSISPLLRESRTLFDLIRDANM